MLESPVMPLSTVLVNRFILYLGMIITFHIDFRFLKYVKKNTVITDVLLSVIHTHTVTKEIKQYYRAY